jgi:hypothetical protein
MWDRTPITRYFRRTTAIESELGTADHHLARFAAASV